tara:strand:- start:483 stop:2363 length:1881 start_codon:yes stop_codon:yes gene_type:complete
MLGFDAYAKSNFGAILEQRIRIFFSKRFLINYPVILQIKSSNDGDEITNLVEITFDTFKKELEGKNLYYHYAVSSLLLDNPDYDFLTNNEQDTIEFANESIKVIYSKIVKEILGSDNPDVALTETNKLFSFLKSPTYHRLIPSYSDSKGDLLNFERKNTLNETTEFKAPGSQALLGLTPIEKAENEKLRFQDQGRNVPISKIPSPFYIEYFWRMLPSVKQAKATSGKDFKKRLKDNSEKRFGQANLVAGNAIITTFEELRQKYYYAGVAEKNKYIGEYKFQRGVRLMYNLTAFIEETDNTYKVKLGNQTYTFRTLKPKQWLPMFGLNNYENVPNGKADPFPLPFLTNHISENTANFEGTDFKQGASSFLQNAYLKMARSTNPTEMKAKKSKNPTNITLKNDLYFTNTYGIESGNQILKVNKNFYWGYEDSKNYSNVDFFKMRSSKSLISFEIESINLPPNSDGKVTGIANYLNLYFPIILAEELSDDTIGPIGVGAIDFGGVTELKEDKFIDLVDKLLSTNKQIKYLRSTMDYTETKKFLTVEKTASFSFLENIIKENEKNLKTMMESEAKAKEKEELYNTIPEFIKNIVFPDGLKYDKAVFFSTTKIENSLDNLLSNLINFDEET